MITLPSTVRDRSESVTRRLRRLLREVGEFFLTCYNENISVRLRDELDDVRHDAGTEDDDGNGGDGGDDDEVEDGGDEVHPVQNGYPAN